MEDYAMKRLVALIAAGFCGVAFAQAEAPEAAPEPASPEIALTSPEGFPQQPAVVSGMPMPSPNRAIAERIVDAMNQGGGFKDSSITVSVTRDDVLLEGSAASQAQVDLAGKIAAGIAGSDHPITNQIIAPAKT